MRYSEFEFYPEQAFQPRPGGGMCLHGGKGGNSAPAPDPRLVEAQIRSMGIQDDMIQEIIGNGRDMAPLQKEQLQFGLDSARTAYGQAQDDREWTLGRREQLSGTQNRLIKDAQEFNTDQRRDQLKGEAYADVNAGFSSARDQGARAMARMGVNPSAGKMQAMNNQASLAQASALASAGNKVNSAARAEGYALTDRAANALAGYPAMGMQATGAGAGYGMTGATMAAQGLAGMNSSLGQAGQMAGQMGQNATSMYGTQSRDYYGQEGGDGFGSILGGLGGLAAGAAKVAPLFMSDRRLKQDIEVVGRDAATGLALYEFSYRGGNGQRYRGVMADEVAQAFPSAVVRGDDGFDKVNYALLGLEMTEA